MSLLATILSFGLEILTTVFGIKLYLWWDDRNRRKAMRKK